MIALTDVAKTFGRGNVLEGITMRINPGEFVCLTGPSGAGKSTFLMLLIGALLPSRGSITIDDVDIRTIPSQALQLFRQRTGFVFQDGKLLHNRTVRENIAFPLEVCGIADDAIGRRVTELLSMMKLTSRADALPMELSAGEKARTAIARAVAGNPMILLLDEPTGNVDPTQSLAILNLLEEINRAGTTVILATHDAALVDVVKTRVVRLEDGRVTRDSFGTYDHGSRRKHREAPEGRHAMFDGFPLDAPSRISVGGKEVPGKNNGRKKVKITSIGS